MRALVVLALVMMASGCAEGSALGMYSDTIRANKDAVVMMCEDNIETDRCREGVELYDAALSASESLNAALDAVERAEQDVRRAISRLASFVAGEGD